MPYIKVKVAQDLYQELGLCLNMELVRSDSKGSIKFVPLPNEDALDDYERPSMKRSFGNLTNAEKSTEEIVSKVLPSEPASNIAILPSTNINEKHNVKRFKSSHQGSVNSDPCENGNKSKSTCVNQSNLDHFLIPDGSDETSLKNEDAINNQLICNKGNTLLMTSGLQEFISNKGNTTITPEVPANPFNTLTFWNSNKYLCFTSKGTQNDTMSPSQLDSESKQVKSLEHQKKGVEEKVSPCGIRLVKVSARDLALLNDLVVKGYSALSDIGIDKSLDRNPAVPPLTFSNSNKYLCFTSKGTQNDTMSPSQLDSESKQVKSLELSGVENKVSPCSIRLVKVSARDLALLNDLVVKGYSALGDTGIDKSLDRQPAFPPQTFSQLDALKKSADKAGGSSPSAVEYKVYPYQKKSDGPTAPFIYVQNKEGTKARLQCTKCSSLYSSSKSFSSHLPRCQKFKEKKQPQNKFPIKCEWCPLMIFCQASLKRHLKKCPGREKSDVQCISVESDSAVESTSLVNNVVSNENDKYILLKNSDYSIFYIKKKESVKPDK